MPSESEYEAIPNTSLISNMTNTKYYTPNYVTCSDSCHRKYRLL